MAHFPIYGLSRFRCKEKTKKFPTENYFESVTLWIETRYWATGTVLTEKNEFGYGEKSLFKGLFWKLEQSGFQGKERNQYLFTWIVHRSKHFSCRSWRKNWRLSYSAAELDYQCMSNLITLFAFLGLALFQHSVQNQQYFFQVYSTSENCSTSTLMSDI